MSQGLIAPGVQLEGTLRTWINMVGKTLVGHQQAKGYSVTYQPLSQEIRIQVNTAAEVQSDLVVSLCLSEHPLFCVIWFSVPIFWGGA